MEGVFLYASILAIVYALSKLSSLERGNARSLNFSFILLLLGIEAGYGWLYYSENIYQVPHLIRLNTPLVFLVGPAFYFQVRLFRFPNEKFRRKDILHVIPAILCFAYFSSFYFLPVQDKLIYLREVMMMSGMESYVIGGLRRLLQLIYIIAIVIQLKFLWESSMNGRSQSLILALGFLAIWILDVYRFFLNFHWSSGLYDMWLISGLLLVLIFNELSYRSIKQGKYSTSGLGNSSANVVVELRKILTEQKLFLNPKLKLLELASKVELHPNYLSQIINTELETNFNDLVNSYRVEEAKKLLSDQANNNLTLEAIGEMAGFNSSTTFNSAFKRFTNSTPRIYKQLNNPLTK